MELISIKKSTHNTFDLTYQTGFISKRVKIRKIFTDWFGDFYWQDNGKRLCCRINNALLNVYESLEENETFYFKPTI